MGGVKPCHWPLQGDRIQNTGPKRIPVQGKRSLVLFPLSGSLRSDAKKKATKRPHKPTVRISCSLLHLKSLKVDVFSAEERYETPVLVNPAQLPGKML